MLYKMDDVYDVCGWQQIYTILKQPYSDKLRNIETCVSNTKSWSITNKLAFNNDKTEVVYIHSKFCDSSALNSLFIGDCHASIVHEAQSLGIIFDKHSL